MTTKLDFTGLTEFKNKLDEKFSIKGHTHKGFIKTVNSKEPDALGNIEINIPASVDISGKADKATTLAGYGITDGATKTELEGKADKATTLAGYGVTDAYTKDEIDGKLTSAMHYKGSVATVSALPTSDVAVGDLYNVTENGANYAWDGSVWDKLDGVVDLSGKADKYSPALIGIPTAPTADVSTETTQIATTKYVADKIDSKIYHTETDYDVELPITVQTSGYLGYKIPTTEDISKLKIVYHNPQKGRFSITLDDENWSDGNINELTSVAVTYINFEKEYDGHLKTKNYSHIDTYNVPSYKDFNRTGCISSTGSCNFSISYIRKGTLGDEEYAPNPEDITVYAVYASYQVGEIPTIEYVDNAVNNANYLTEHQDISGKLDRVDIVVCTQAEYDAMTSRDENKYYFITE